MATRTDHERGHLVSRRYQFDNPLPAVRESAPPVYQPQPLSPVYGGQPQQVVVQHIHQAPPDRTVQRVALGAGVGGGVVAAGVIFLPLLIEALDAMVASLVVLAVMAAVGGWTVVQVLNSIGSKDQQATKVTGKSLLRKGR